MKNRRTLRSLLAALCCMAMLLAWLPVIPAAAGSVLLSEDFESYKVGTDSFYNANTDEYIYYNSYHGSTSDESYATYGIASEGSNQFLRLSSRNGKHNWFLTKDKFTGAYTLTMEVRTHSPNADGATPSFIINPFQGNTFGSGKVGLLYFDPRNGARFTEAITTGSNVTNYLKQDGATFKPAYDTWYNLKIQVEVGKLTISAWEKAGVEHDAGKLEWECDLITADVLAKGSQIRIQNMGRAVAGVDIVTDIDNIVLTGGGSTSTGSTSTGSSTGSSSSGSTGSSSSGSTGSSTGAISGGDLGDNNWVMLNDTFESYPAGQDTFFNANKDVYSYYTSYHGTYGEASYSTYGIAQGDGSKALKLTSVNATRNYFVTKLGISGAYSVQMDIMMEQPAGSSAPGYVFNLFQGSAFPNSGKTILCYVDNYGFRITDNATTGSNVSTYVKQNGSNMKVQYDTWYTIKLTCEEGRMTLKAWEKGGSEPADGAAEGVAVVETSVISKSILSNANNLRVQTRERNEAGVGYTCWMDNLTISKPYDAIVLPTVVYGIPGEKLETTATFTGQDLAAQTPAPTYTYSLSNAALGSVNSKGELILGQEGKGTLSVELLDVMGNPSGVKGTTQLVVGTSNGITPDQSQIKVPESAIGSTKTVTLTKAPEVQSKYPSSYVVWSSSNESVATVDSNGVIAVKGFGSALITAKVMNTGNKETEFFANITLQVGETPLRILSIGNSYSRDSFYYLSSLAAVAGYRVETAYLQKDSGTIRHHARNIALSTADYSYWKSNAMTGAMGYIGKVTIQDAVEEGNWDIIMLHQGTEAAGWSDTYSTDLDFILDYLTDVAPESKVYWNMTWAYQQNIAGTRGTNMKTYFDGSQAVMYNAYVNCIEEHIVGKDATFAADIDGWFPVGAAIQTLRGTYGDTLTRDGFHLNFGAGRLTAAMTILKTLYPDVDLSIFTPAAIAPFLDLDQYDEGIKDDDVTTYVNNEANLNKIKAAVNAATADLSRAPAKVAVPAQVRIEDKTQQGDFTVAQMVAPQKLHFPDITVLKDGTVLVSAYENVNHYPNNKAGETNYGMEGPGRLVVWKSTDNGKTFDVDNPLLVVDEPLLEQWGVAETSNRYERWKDGETDYIFNADPRDPNFGVVYTDVTGDGVEDEVILLTFWMRNYRESAAATDGLFMCQSADGGKTWSAAQKITMDGTIQLKRGDITAFSDGQILIPTYRGKNVGCILMKWDMAKKQWVEVSHSVITDRAPEETGTNEHNECSFIAPDPDGDTVYCMIRANGTVLRSDDRGMTWTLIGNEDGLIHQPGFSPLDENRVFVTWARTGSPRFIYGKAFYYEGDWTDTQTQLIYASPVEASHDMGDPSCKLLKNGKVMVVCYDTAYRSIVGTLVDPNSSDYQLVEMNLDAKESVLFEKKDAGTSVTASVQVDDGYTAGAEVAFEQGGQLTIQMVNNAKVTFKVGADGIQAGKTYNVRVVSGGATLYTKVWEVGAAEPAAWKSVKADSAANTGKVVFSGQAIKLNSVKVSTRIYVDIPETASGVARGSVVTLPATVMPAALKDKAVWSSSDPNVVKVDQDGKLTFVGVGKATVSLSVNGAEAQCQVTVTSAPAEVTGKGEKVVLFSDDFQSYSDSSNLWSQMKSSGKYNTSTTGESGNSSTLKLQSQGSDKHLVLGGKSSWVRATTPLSGDVTVQFDFRFSGAGVLYLTLNQGAEDTYATRAFLHLNSAQSGGSGTRVQYDNEAGEAANFPAAAAMHSGMEGKVDWDLNQWYTVKFARAGDGMYVKVWAKGQPEPESWGQQFNTANLNTGLAANQNTYLRMQWASDSALHIDNLVVTQQQGKGADFMNDVSEADWFYDAVDYAIKNDIMSGYNKTTFGPNDTLSRAMVVQVLYNKEGKPALNGATHAFPDVPATQWFNNAVTWGSNKGVVSGFGDGKFRPDDAVTVEQVAVILHNYSGKPASSVTPTGVGKYDDWAAQALGWAQEQGILKDVPFTNATENATRAQTAQMLMNFLSK